jgi:hypothetical protein
MVFRCPPWTGGSPLEWIQKLPATTRENDWQRAKSRLFNRISMETQTRAGLMKFLARGYFVQQQFIVPSKVMAKLEAVSLNEYRDTVERFFGQDKFIEVQW